MTDDFKYQCTRRPTRQDSAVEEATVMGLEIFGAGSGGGSGVTEDKFGNKSVTAKEGLSLNGAAVWVTGLGDGTATPEVSILAGEADELNGRVNAHGSQG